MDLKTALVEQDYLRRTVLNEKGSLGGDDHIELIRNVVKFSLDKKYDVILEGIFHKEYYSDLIFDLLKYNEENYLFFFDIPLEETIERHQTKSNAHEFGEKELREWYREGEALGIKDEVIISKDMSVDESLELILNTIN